MMKFAEVFPHEQIVSSLIRQLTWTFYNYNLSEYILVNCYRFYNKKLIIVASLKSLKITLPSPKTLEQFNKVFHQITRRRQNLYKENQQLASLRDWLLPMLMNGQVTVKQAI